MAYEGNKLVIMEYLIMPLTGAIDLNTLYKKDISADFLNNMNISSMSSPSGRLLAIGTDKGHVGILDL